MARIRSIHPGLWTDEAFVSVSPLARLLFLGLLNESDDQGAFEWKPVQIKMRVLPADNADVKALLGELEGAKVVRRYEVSGASYGAVRNFRQWQRPKKPNSIHPMPHEFRTYAGPKANSSEPTDDDDGDSSPPPDFELSPVPHRLPTGGRKAPQMEEGGDKGRKKDSSSNGRASEADFAQFWDAYPRKIGKGQARRAFDTAVHKTDLPTILGAIKGQDWNPDPQYQPHPSTWLNGERWADQQPQPNGKPKMHPSSPECF